VQLVTSEAEKVLEFYAGFCAHPATCPKADGKDITDLKLILSGNPARRMKQVWFSDQRRQAP